MASATAVASVRPDLIKNLFVTKNLNQPGSYEVKLYMRGKPWSIMVDDVFLINNDEQPHNDYLNEFDIQKD